MALIEAIKKNKKRLIAGVIIGLSALFCVVRGGIPLVLLVALFVFLGSLEYIKIIENKGFFPFKKVILAVNFSILLLVALKGTEYLAMVVSFGTIAAFLAVLFKGRQPYTANIATTVLGFLYGSLPIHIILIRQLNYAGLGFLNFPLNDGLGFIILIFFTILLTDVGAYYFGSKYGKTLLCPIVSPKKTVEGAVGGALVAVAISMIIGSIIHLAWYHALIVGLLITIFAQLGDLSESLLKRDAGVKDSGDSIPGHGGFLDRADSYIFSAPVAYYYLYYFVVNQNNILEFTTAARKVIHVFGL